MLKWVECRVGGEGLRNFGPERASKSCGPAGEVGRDDHEAAELGGETESTDGAALERISTEIGASAAAVGDDKSDTTN